jgi:hypothetical protein
MSALKHAMKSAWAVAQTFVQTGQLKASEEVFEKRVAICLVCENVRYLQRGNPNNNNPLYANCTICKCMVLSKTILVASKCPLENPKW